jgi:hypothetical protein
MNWRLIFILSLFGALMGLATTFLIPTTIEPALWLVIIVFCAWVIARRCEKRFFLHGLALGIANSVWVTSLHVVLIDQYLRHNPNEAAMTQRSAIAPRMMMLMIGPAIGIGSGIVLGLVAMIAARVVRRSANKT